MEHIYEIDITSISNKSRSNRESEIIRLTANVENTKIAIGGSFIDYELNLANGIMPDPNWLELPDVRRYFDAKSQLETYLANNS